MFVYCINRQSILPEHRHSDRDWRYSHLQLWSIVPFHQSRMYKHQRHVCFSISDDCDDGKQTARTTSCVCKQFNRTHLWLVQYRFFLTCLQRSFVITEIATDNKWYFRKLRCSYALCGHKAFPLPFWFGDYISGSTQVDIPNSIACRYIYMYKCRWRTREVHNLAIETYGDSPI